MSWPADATFYAANPEMHDRTPDAIQLLENMKLSNSQQAPMILDVDVNGMTVEEAVEKWMTENEDVWRSWIPS